MLTFNVCLVAICLLELYKKLAEKDLGTAHFVTNVGNEQSEVLISVMTTAEGMELDAMASGIVQRYEVAGEPPPPAVLHLDRDCSSQQPGDKLISAKIFAAWPDLYVRLDAWHFLHWVLNRLPSTGTAPPWEDCQRRCSLGTR